jgi:hypothetical protein
MCPLFDVGDANIGLGDDLNLEIDVLYGWLESRYCHCTGTRSFVELSPFSAMQKVCKRPSSST